MAIPFSSVSNLENQILQLQIQLQKQDMARIERLERAQKESENAGRKVRVEICEQMHKESDFEIRKLKEEVVSCRKTTSN
jgi:hypothetical protein